MNQSKGLIYGDVGTVKPVAKPSRKRNTRKLARPIESEAVGQPGEYSSEALPEGGEGDALVEIELDI